MAWWSRRRSVPVEVQSNVNPDSRDSLLAAFLEIERTRVERHAELEAKRHEVELKKAELELHELERIGTEKRKNALFQEELHEKKRENLRKAREALKAKKLESLRGQPALFNCEECQALTEGREVTHSSDLIRHKIERHSERLFPPANGSTH